MNKVQNILEAAQAACRGMQKAKDPIIQEKGRRLEGQVCNLYPVEYAEPGYEGWMIAANWNPIDRYDPSTKTRVPFPGEGWNGCFMERLGKRLEAAGIELEWEDEWSTCSECNRAVRTSPDSYSWKPSYVLGECELLCMECILEDPAEYLASLEGAESPSASPFDLSDLNPTEHGYRCILERQVSGFHGSDRSPENRARDLTEQGLSRFLFTLDSTEQFQTYWSLWLHEDDPAVEDLLNRPEEWDDDLWEGLTFVFPEDEGL